MSAWSLVPWALAADRVRLHGIVFIAPRSECSKCISTPDPHSECDAPDRTIPFFTYPCLPFGASMSAPIPLSFLEQAGKRGGKLRHQRPELLGIPPLAASLTAIFRNAFFAGRTLGTARPKVNARTSRIGRSNHCETGTTAWVSFVNIPALTSDRRVALATRHFIDVHSRV